MNGTQPEQIYCQDEMRYGTRTQVGRRWMPFGERPICPVGIGYEWGLLYVALCPYNGHLFAMLLPNMNTLCFTVFRQALLEYTRHNITLLLDRASSHRAAGMIEQVDQVFFPAACPELNPVEGFFKELRKELKCRVFETLQQIESRIIVVLHRYWQNPAAVVSLTCFPYFNTQ